MVTKEINILDEITSYAEIHSIKPAEIDAMMLDFAKRITRILRIERINVWIFDSNKSQLVSIAEYDQRTDVFQKDSILKKNDYPKYFELLKENKFLYIQDCFTDERVDELKESYFIPTDVITLVDVPLRIGNDLIGVMCFEKTGRTIRNYTEQNLNFIYSIAMVMSSNLEARYRRAIQHKLDESLQEKEILIQEINHRVKNNFSILLSLLRFNKKLETDSRIQVLCSEYEQRIYSMLKIHELLLANGLLASVDLSFYLNELICEYTKTYDHIDYKIQISEVHNQFDTKKALNIGMIVTEIFLNTIKHAKNEIDKVQFHLEFYEANDIHYLKIGDNGPGFDYSLYEEENTLGLMLIRNLAETISAEIIFPKIGHSFYEIRFK